MRKTLLLIALLAAVAFAQNATKNQKTDMKHDMKNHSMSQTMGHEFKPADSLQWGAMPPGLPAGGQMAVLSGDPTKSGEFVVRLKAPAGYKIPAHWHPTTENVTIISGDFYVGLGDKLDEASARNLKAGDFVMLPAEHRHFAFAKSESVVQIASMGPFQITYVNSSDDPRNKK